MKRYNSTCLFILLFVLSHTLYASDKYLFHEPPSYYINIINELNDIKYEKREEAMLKIIKIGKPFEVYLNLDKWIDYPEIYQRITLLKLFVKYEINTEAEYNLVKDSILLLNETDTTILKRSIKNIYKQIHSSRRNFIRAIYREYADSKIEEYVFRLLKKYDLKYAAMILEKKVSFNPGNNLFIKVANLYFKLGDIDKAISYLDKVDMGEFKEEDYSTYYSLKINIYLSINKYDEVLKSYRFMIKKYPENKSLMEAMARILELTGQNDELFKVYEKILNLSENKEYYSILEHLKDIDNKRAMELAIKLKDINDNYSLYYFILQSYMEIKQYENAYPYVKLCFKDEVKTNLAVEKDVFPLFKEILIKTYHDACANTEFMRELAYSNTTIIKYINIFKYMIENEQYYTASFIAERILIILYGPIETPKYSFENYKQGITEYMANHPDAPMRDKESFSALLSYIRQAANLKTEENIYEDRVIFNNHRMLSKINIPPMMNWSNAKVYENMIFTTAQKEKIFLIVDAVNNKILQKYYIDQIYSENKLPYDIVKSKIVDYKAYGDNVALLTKDDYFGKMKTNNRPVLTSFNLLCINSKTGKIIWKKQADMLDSLKDFSREYNQKIIFEINDNKILLGINHLNVFSLDDGNSLLSLIMPQDYDLAILVNDDMIVSNKNRLVAFNINTMEIKWEIKNEMPLDYITVNNNNLIAFYPDWTMKCINYDSGKVKWEFVFSGYVKKENICFGKNMIYASTHNNDIYALDFTGKMVWHKIIYETDVHNSQLIQGDKFLVLKCKDLHFIINKGKGKVIDKILKNTFALLISDNILSLFYLRRINYYERDNYEVFLSSKISSNAQAIEEILEIIKTNALDSSENYNLLKMGTSIANNKNAEIVFKSLSCENNKTFTEDDIRGILNTSTMSIDDEYSTNILQSVIGGHIGKINDSLLSKALKNAEIKMLFNKAIKDPESILPAEYNSIVESKNFVDSFSYPFFLAMLKNKDIQIKYDAAVALNDSPFGRNTKDVFIELTKKDAWENKSLGLEYLFRFQTREINELCAKILEELETEKSLSLYQRKAGGFASLILYEHEIKNELIDKYLMNASELTDLPEDISAETLDLANICLLTYWYRNNDYSDLNKFQEVLLSWSDYPDTLYRLIRTHMNDKTRNNIITLMLELKTAYADDKEQYLLCENSFVETLLIEDSNELISAIKAIISNSSFLQLACAYGLLDYDDENIDKFLLAEFLKMPEFNINSLYSQMLKLNLLSRSDNNKEKIKKILSENLKYYEFYPEVRLQKLKFGLSENNVTELDFYRKQYEIFKNAQTAYMYAKALVFVSKSTEAQKEISMFIKNNPYDYYIPIYKLYTEINPNSYDADIINKIINALKNKKYFYGGSRGGLIRALIKKGIMK